MRKDFHCLLIFVSLWVIAWWWHPCVCIQGVTIPKVNTKMRSFILSLRNTIKECGNNRVSYNHTTHWASLELRFPRVSGWLYQLVWFAKGLSFISITPDMVTSGDLLDMCLTLPDLCSHFYIWLCDKIFYLKIVFSCLLGSD